MEVGISAFCTFVIDRLTTFDIYDNYIKDNFSAFTSSKHLH